MALKLIADLHNEILSKNARQDILKFLGFHYVELFKKAKYCNEISDLNNQIDQIKKLMDNLNSVKVTMINSDGTIRFHDKSSNVYITVVANQIGQIYHDIVTWLNILKLQIKQNKHIADKQQQIEINTVIDNIINEATEAASELSPPDDFQQLLLKWQTEFGEKQTAVSEHSPSNDSQELVLKSKTKNDEKHNDVVTKTKLVSTECIKQATHYLHLSHIETSIRLSQPEASIGTAIKRFSMQSLKQGYLQRIKFFSDNNIDIAVPGALAAVLKYQAVQLRDKQKASVATLIDTKVTPAQQSEKSDVSSSNQSKERDISSSTSTRIESKQENGLKKSEDSTMKMDAKQEVASEVNSHTATPHTNPPKEIKENVDDVDNQDDIITQKLNAKFTTLYKARLKADSWLPFTSSSWRDQNKVADNTWSGMFLRNFAYYSGIEQGKSNKAETILSMQEAVDNRIKALKIMQNSWHRGWLSLDYSYARSGKIAENVYAEFLNRKVTITAATNHTALVDEIQRSHCHMKCK